MCRQQMHWRYENVIIYSVIDIWLSFPNIAHARCEWSFILDCWNIPHGKITNETGPNMATPTKASKHYDTQPRLMSRNWPSHHYSSFNADKVYSQGNSATLTCDSGYVINDSRYLKTAPIFCNYASLDGSTWKLIPKENNDKPSLKPAACIRGKRKY